MDPGAKEKGDKTRVCTKYSFQIIKLTKICLSRKETGGGGKGKGTCCSPDTQTGVPVDT